MEADNKLQKFIDYCESHDHGCTEGLSRIIKSGNREKLIEKLRQNPKRRQIIALGFNQAVSKNEVNHILAQCGLPKLYVRNLCELSVGFSLDQHSQNALNESIEDAINNWYQLYLAVKQAYSESDIDTNPAHLAPASFTLEGLKAFDERNRSGPGHDIHDPMTDAGLRRTSVLECKVSNAKNADDLIALVKEDASLIREQRANARLIFARYLYYYIEAMMQYYGRRQQNHSALTDLFDHSGATEDHYVDLSKTYTNKKISLYGVVKRMAYYYYHVGDGKILGIKYDDIEDIKKDEDTEAIDTIDSKAKYDSDNDHLTVEDRDYCRYISDYFVCVLKGTKDITRPMLMFFLLFVNSLLSLDGVLPDYRDDIVLDQTRLSSILERCFGQGLSPMVSLTDKLVHEIVNAQEQYHEMDTILRSAPDYKLYDAFMNSGLDVDSLLNELDKPMGSAFTMTYDAQLSHNLLEKN